MNPQTLLFSHTHVQKFIYLKFLRFWTGDSGLYRPGDSGLEESPPLKAEYPALPPETPALNGGDSSRPESPGLYRPESPVQNLRNFRYSNFGQVCVRKAMIEG